MKEEKTKDLGVSCSECNERPATKCWIGGQKLCDICFDAWDTKHKKLRENPEISIVKVKQVQKQAQKQTGQLTLF